MIPMEDMREALQDQFQADYLELDKLNGELKELRAAYTRYLDVLALSKERRERLVTIGSLIAGSDQVDKDILEDAIAERELNAKELKAKPPLWKAIKEIVRLAHEIQVIDLEFVLEQLGLKVSRPAVESALETHEDAFRVVRRGREKFVLMK
jgi:hypothetical protein